MQENDRQKIEEGLTSEDLIVRKSNMESYVQLLSSEQLKRGTKDPSPIIRYIIANKKENLLKDKESTRVLLNDTVGSVVASLFDNRGVKVTKKWLKQNFINHESWLVRRSILKNNVLTPKQIKDSLRDPVWMVRAGAYKNYAHTLSESESNEALKDTNSHIRMSIAKRNEYENNAYQIEAGLIDFDPKVRVSFIKVAKSLSASQINRCLKDKSLDVKLATIGNSHLIFNKEHIEILMSDKDPSVRIRCVSLSETRIPSLSDKQIESMLNDKDDRVRVAFLRNRIDINLTEKKKNEIFEDANLSVKFALVNRQDFSPNQNQITRLLEHKYAQFREALAKNESIVLDNEQIRKGLSDKSSTVRLEFMGRKDFKITESDIETCLKKNDILVLLALIRRKDVDFTEGQIERFLTHKNSSIRGAFIEKHADILTEEQMDGVIKDGDPFVKISILEMEHISLTKEQIETLLTDGNHHVRHSCASRSDINFTQDQIKRGLEDEDDSVREIFQEKHPKHAISGYMPYKKRSHI